MNTKAKSDSYNQQITLMMKSGKAALGFKSALKTIRNSSSQLVLYSSNLPILR